jgi:branched-chain amino acid transport system substrate-binding protein
MWRLRRGAFSGGGPLRWLAGIGAAAVVAAACGGGSAGGTGGGSQSSASPLTVCLDVALSGPFVQLGQYDALGAKAYFQALNKHGGVLGHQVNVVEENNQSSPPNAANLARKCVTDDKANFILGAEETSSSAAVVPVADALQTVTIGMQSGWNMQGLTQPQLHSYSFPGFYNVFYQDDVDTVQKLIVPRHYTRVAVIQDATSGGLPNEGYMRTLGKKYHFDVVAAQNNQPGATNVTPQVLDLLSAKPQIIVLGLTPGPDTITSIKAIRAQDPNIPISECSGCWLPSFLSAVGGAATMQNVYSLGNIQQLAAALPNNANNKSTLADVNSYLDGMRAAGFSSADQLGSGTIGWTAGEELVNAIKTAKSTSENAVRDALRHQNFNSMGVYWARTPQDYARITKVKDAMMIVTASGQQQVISAGDVVTP